MGESLSDSIMQYERTETIVFTNEKIMINIGNWLISINSNRKYMK